jgi:DNA mismatch endonuclease, patch repair protein
VTSKKNSFPKNEDKTEFGGLTRSKLMSRIRGSGNASTELRFLALIRSCRIKGWRRHYPLPGKPDFAFPKSKLVVFIDGCFWHGHNCSGRKPKRNTEAWVAKFNRNKKRDLAVTRELRRHGWKVFRIWECILAKDPERCIKRLTDGLANS